jgi:hypothetical protein
MFPWPKTDNPLDWFLEWLAGAVGGFISRIVLAVADLFSGRGTFTQWIVISLFVAASLLLWDALTFQCLLYLSHRFGSSFPP